MTGVDSSNEEAVRLEEHSDECVSISSSGWLEIAGQSWKGSCHAHLTLPIKIDGTTISGLTSPGRRYNLLNESSPRICDSICFGTIASRNDNNIRDRDFPQYLMCLATLTINNARQNQHLPGKRFLRCDPIRLPWLYESAYLNIHDEMVGFVNQQEPKAKRSYLKTIHVRLLQWNINKYEQADSCVIEQKADWVRRVPRMVAKYCGRKTRRPLPFHLELNIDFEYFTLETSSVQEIGRVLEDTELKNFDRNPYWSKKLLKNLFDRTTVQHIVASHIATPAEQRGPGRKQNHKQALTEDQYNEFVDWILPDRIRLLATAIRCNINIDCLYDMMRSDVKDIMDGQIPLDEKTLRKFLRPASADHFKTSQKGFRPYNFPDPEPEPEDEDVEDDAIKIDQLIPIDYDVDNEIGHGGFGRVYEVTIHPDFHAFSPDRNEKLALKVISDSTYNPAANEVKAWQLVAKISHPHITPLYTSWLQNNQCFMLSPLADENLHDFLSRGQPFDISQTEWLLEQMEGLAAGIHHIHHIGRISLGEPGKLKRLKWFDCGYHHDLKPANILVFGRKTWKIGDFGTAKIRQLVSGNTPASQHYTSSYPGDAEYGGPDRYWKSDSKKHSARSYDIWSFGCILLEVLLWASGRGGTNLKSFREDRQKDPCDQCPCSASDSENKTKTPNHNDNSDDDPCDDHGGPRFWYKCKKGDGAFHLKSCVKENLDRAKNYFQTSESHPILSLLCERVELMLSVNPEDRPSASDIKDRIGQLRFRANFHFRPGKSKLDPEITSQPDTSKGPISRHNSPNPPSHRVQEDEGYGGSSTTSFQKRKADDYEVDNNCESWPLPSETMQYIGGHLSPSSARNTPASSSDTTTHDRGRQFKKPRPPDTRLMATCQTFESNISPSSTSTSSSSSHLPSFSSSAPQQASDRHQSRSGETESPGRRRATPLRRLVKKHDDPSLAQKMAEGPSSKFGASRSMTF